MPRALLFSLVSCFALAACTDRSASSTRQTLKGRPDTVLLAGGTALWEPRDGYARIDAIARAKDGRTAIFDAGGPALYIVDRDGRTGRKISRSGSGPGEYRHISALLFLDDGRLVAKDMLLSRLMIMSTDYAVLSHLSVSPSELLGQNALRSLDGTKIVVSQSGPPRGGFELSTVSWQVVDTTSRDNRHVDLPADIAEQCPIVYLSSDPPVRNSYAPEPQLTLLPTGGVVVGCASSRRLELRRSGRPVRVLELQGEPVERSVQERVESKERFTGLVRREVPGWSWQGSDIPTAHPPFLRTLSGNDGSIWLKTPRPSERCSETEPECAWRTRSGFTVYDSSGVPVRVVNVPKRFSFRVDPVLSLDEVTAVVLDDEDLPHVIRFRLGKKEL